MPAYADLEGRLAGGRACRRWLALSAAAAFALGLLFGLSISVLYLRQGAAADPRRPNASEQFVSFVDEGQSAVGGGVYWGAAVERRLPAGYADADHAAWRRHVRASAAVKLEGGCGRMQNRMVVFGDGSRGCVRYRQNTDQIQGELFSFYLAQILGLPNLAPSSVTVVDLKSPLWSNVASDISAAQWSANKPVVITKYIDNLLHATIPQVFKPTERHLNRLDVINMTARLTPDQQAKSFVELAQWSDLIVFDYLTANLDRIVNNLYNFQWNVNIMDAPAHNLARRADTDLLVFLDNESGLLHGYRLLKKYEVYHSVLLENLCVFRRTTADAIRALRERRDVGARLRGMFEGNGDAVKDLLPMLPPKSVKILNERIDRVYGQIVRCEAMFGDGT